MGELEVGPGGRLKKFWSLRYSPQTVIGKNNVNQLQVGWILNTRSGCLPATRPG